MIVLILRAWIFLNEVHFKPGNTSHNSARADFTGEVRCDRVRGEQDSFT